MLEGVDRPALAVRGSLRHIFASRFALGMSCLGVAIFVVGAAIGPVGAALAIVTIGGLAWQWRRLRRRRIEVDAPGDGRRVLQRAPWTGSYTVGRFN
mgnify:CR=1 FL=1